MNTYPIINLTISEKEVGDNCVGADENAKTYQSPTKLATHSSQSIIYYFKPRLGYY